MVLLLFRKRIRRIQRTRRKKKEENKEEEEKTKKMEVVEEEEEGVCLGLRRWKQAGFEYDRFPINKDSRDNGGCSFQCGKEGSVGGGEGGRG